MIPGSFEYHRPSSLSDAIGLLSSYGNEAMVVAGGHSLIPMMKLRMAMPGHLVDLQDIQTLKSISIKDDEIILGAMVTQAEIIGSDDLAKFCPLLQEVAIQIADPQVRYLGTIGGNIANGDPANDMPAVMQTLDAALILTGPNGSKEVPARRFYHGAYDTERKEGEILSAIKIPVPTAGHGYAYEKQKRKIGDYATAAAAVVIAMSNGICTSASIGLTNLSETPLWAEKSASILIGTDLNKEAVKAASAIAKAISNPAEDGRGPAEFRTHVAGIMVERAIAKAHSRAQ
ncbi:xanthine dehydrogenase family protein subunit M [Kiloniella sp. EL199]|uniref:FAD binding domain-containing protein n=1 Tax=Kiloniella sp. EL199 TaxID=2107581 RepID=UPI000EA2A6F6|nr:xanthine dehydrogenase family protein subunit M [Kiloniella sp. EL199]